MCFQAQLQPGSSVSLSGFSLIKPAKLDAPDSSNSKFRTEIFIVCTLLEICYMYTCQCIVNSELNWLAWAH